ncbi:MAG: hypothetical protein E7616_05205 [Ruminococcaceae bacterium]|nr:hypothetical protein [Oscillospiraceae bacterium]
MKGKRLTLILLVLGVLLIAGAAGYFVWMRYSISQNAKYAKKTVETLYTLMPEVSSGALDDRQNAAMSAIEVNGNSFVGIIEVPAYESKLPIYAKWDGEKTVCFPCRYLGSLYNGTLIIGGSDNDGQLDFIGEISIGQTVYITDTLGVRYAYSVSSIRRVKDVSTENLCKEKTALTIFAKNSLDFDYTVVYCDVSVK